MKQIHAYTGRKRWPPVAAAMLCAALLAWSLAAPAQSIRLGYAGPPESASYLGARQGLIEANLQGRFLGQEYALDNVDVDGLLRGGASGYLGLVVDTDAATLMAIASAAGDVPVFNVGTDDDALRTACLANVLHVIPSARMKSDAMAQWRQAHPGAVGVAAAWHPDYVKFAARDLNKRFEKEFGRPMDDHSWSGWAAVKMISDSVAREGITSPGALLDFMKTRLSFDGQKGIDMNFRVTGQLRQTLLIVDGTEILGEAPVRGVVDPDDLDSLGDGTCAK